MFQEILGMFMPFSHEEAEAHYQNVYSIEEIQPHHKASLTHEIIAGAAGFAAMRAYESHLRATGQQPSHSLMKEILAGIAAAEVDKLVETKGLDWIDRGKAKKLAEKQAHELAEQRYQGGTGWEYAQAEGGYAAEYEYNGGVPFGAPGHACYEGYNNRGYGAPERDVYVEKDYYEQSGPSGERYEESEVYVQADEPPHAEGYYRRY